MITVLDIFDDQTDVYCQTLVNDMRLELVQALHIPGSPRGKVRLFFRDAPPAIVPVIVAPKKASR